MHATAIEDDCNSIESKMKEAGIIFLKQWWIFKMTRGIKNVHVPKIMCYRVNEARTSRSRVFPFCRARDKLQSDIPTFFIINAHFKTGLNELRIFVLPSPVIKFRYGFLHRNNFLNRLRGKLFHKTLCVRVYYIFLVTNKAVAMAISAMVVMS